VLVADDANDIQILVARFLSDVNAEVEVASDGEQAVAQVLTAEREARPFDVVLMDLHMPAIDGAEAVRMLRAAGVRRPVIALTASANLEDRDRCTQAGYNDFLTKPIDRAQLIQKITTFCGSSAPTDQVPDTSHEPSPGEVPDTSHEPSPGEVPDTSHEPSPGEVPDTSRAGGFDAGRLLGVVGGDQGAWQAVMALFGRDAPPLLQAIRGAVAGDDLPLVRDRAHKLKGMLLNVGAADTARVAGELEGAARSGARDQLPSLATRLASDVAQICESMATHSRSAA
jgi:CheY-like chemotaxis protein